MTFVPFDPHDLLAVVDPKEGAEKTCDLIGLGEECKRLGPCLTLMDGEKMIACGGIVLRNEISGELWLRLSSQAGPHAVKAIKAQVDRWIAEFHLQRVQATGPVSWEILPRWWEFMGMHREGLMEKYGPHGEDCYMYARIM